MIDFSPSRSRSRKFQSAVPMPDLNEFVTVQEAAEELGFNVQSIRHMYRQGTLKGRKIQRTILIYKSAIADYQDKTKGMSKNDPRRSKITN
jgi:hypothetical protein